jgi:hypothetical protein
MSRPQDVVPLEIADSPTVGESATNAPAAVTLYPKRSSGVLLVVVCLVFVTLGVWIGWTDDWFGYVAASFFFIGVVAAFVTLLPGSTFLRIDATGLTFANLFRTTHLPWQAIDRFFVIAAQHHKMVALNFAPSYEPARLGRRACKLLTGCEGALPDTYGKKAEELADFLNRCLDEFNRNGPTAAPSSPESRTSG